MGGWGAWAWAPCVGVRGLRCALCMRACADVGALCMGVWVWVRAGGRCALHACMDVCVWGGGGRVGEGGVACGYVRSSTHICCM